MKISLHRNKIQNHSSTNNNDITTPMLVDCYHRTPLHSRVLAIVCCVVLALPVTIGLSSCSEEDTVSTSSSTRVVVQVTGDECSVGLVGSSSSSVTTSTTSSVVYSSTNTLVGDTNEEQVWNFLKSEGFTDEQAAGIMGNFFNENSAYDPQVCQNGETHSEVPTSDSHEWGYGIAQWTTTGRRQDLYNYCQEQGISSGELLSQLQFFIYEFSSSYEMETYLEMSDSTIDELTMWFHNKYEGSGDNEEQLQERVDDAYEIYEKYAGTSATVSSSDACDDYNSNLSAAIADAAEYHLVQQTSNNCGAAAFTMAINLLLGDPDAYDDKEVWEQMGSDTTTIGWTSGNDMAANWLKAVGLNSKIEVTEVQEIQDREDLIEHLENGELCVVSSVGNVFLHKDGTTGDHEKGHYILFYAYKNGTFYVLDSAVSADKGACVEYSATDVDNFFAGRTSTGGSVSVKLK